MRARARQNRALNKQKKLAQNQKKSRCLSALVSNHQGVNNNASRISAMARSNREILTGGKKYTQNKGKKHLVEEVVFNKDDRE